MEKREEGGKGKASILSPALRLCRGQVKEKKKRGSTGEYQKKKPKRRKTGCVICGIPSGGKKEGNKGEERVSILPSSPRKKGGGKGGMILAIARFTWAVAVREEKERRREGKGEPSFDGKKRGKKKECVRGHWLGIAF